MDRVAVSLQDILIALGGPLEERALWALLYKACSLLEQELKHRNGKNVDLLVTLETVTLHHGGAVKFPRGVIDSNSDYQAPEVKLQQLHTLTQMQQEKSYVYSLGITLFTAMQYDLDSSQIPQVSEDINRVLIGMVEEDEGERMLLADILTLCRDCTDEDDANREVDRLVSYVMGPEEDLELSLSEQGDVEELADDANLETELNEVMNLHPTGSVEQLYSPSYGNRGSSLSINSAAGRLNSSFKSHDSGSADLQLHYSSMPMVYSSSQDRLHPRRGSSSDNDSWSSFDHLTPHLQSHEIEILASKAQGSRPPHSHTRYIPHFYTPTRVRKGGYKDVNRSASFEHGSLGIYRTSSDGTRQRRNKTIVNETLGRQERKREIQVQSTPEKKSRDQPGINSFPIDDMPPLPPTAVIADISMDSPMKNEAGANTSPEVQSTVDTIDSILQSIERGNGTGGLPPYVPHSEPPMFTPVKQGVQPQSLSPESPQTNTSFDYSDLDSLPHTPHSMADRDDFNFSSPPPIPGSSPPQEEDNSTDMPAIALIQPLMTTGPVEEGWKDKNETNIDRTITPRRALDEAFKQLDKIGESQLDDSEDEPPSNTGKVTGPKEGASTITQVADDMYAKVDMIKKRNKDVEGAKEESDDDEGPPITPYREPPEPTGDGPHETNIHQSSVDPAYEDIEFGDKDAPTRLPIFNDPGYEKVEFGNSNDTKPKQNLFIDEEPGYARIGDVLKRPISEDFSKTHGDNVHKASSEANVRDIDTAKVYPPQRASMPASVLLESNSPPRKVENSSHDNELIATDDATMRKKSIQKLQTVFGPEFTKLSGGAKLNHAHSLIQVAEGRRLVKVTLLTGKSVHCVVDKDSKCQELFQQVVAHQSLQEKRIFGLAVLRDGDELFLDLDRKLLKYAPDGWHSTSVPSPGSTSSKPPVFSTFFRVQYYVENALTDLKLRETRHQLYLQLRKDTVEGKMYCHEESALKLAAYALQAEKGDHQPTYKNKSYFRLEDYVPEKTFFKLGAAQTKRALQAIHAEQRGKGREEAELSFLREAQTLPEYGMVFYQMSRSKRGPHGEVWLGFSIRGIVVFNVHKDVRTPVVRSSWSTTENISFANRKFIIEPKGSQPQTFYTLSYKRARYLLHLSISYHRFQFVSRPPLEPDPIPQSHNLTIPNLLKPPNPGYDTLVKCSSQMIDSLSQQPKAIATSLSNAHLISRDLLSRVASGKVAVTNRESADKLQLAVSQTVESNPGKFTHFVSVLREDLTLYGELLTVLNEAYKAANEGEGLPGYNDEIYDVKILKEKGKGLGIRITSQPIMDGQRSSVFIDSVDRDGPAYMDGRLKKGDVLVSAEGQSLEGLDHKEVGEILKQSNNLVRLSVKRSQSEVSPPLSSSVATTESVVVEIEEAPPTTESHKRLKRATTLEIFSTDAASVTTPPASPASKEVMSFTVDRGDNKSFGFAIASGDFEGIIVYKVTADGPADRAGLKQGDTLLTVNDSSTETQTYNQVLSGIQQSGEILSLSISRPTTAWSHDNLPPPGVSFKVELKKQRGSLGLRLAGGKDKQNGLGFIYVKSVVEGSAADNEKIEVNDILMTLNGEQMVGNTHRDAATAIAHSGMKVALHLHRPYDSSWLEPSREAYLKTKRQGIVREESSTAIFLDNRPLSQVGAPVDLSSIQEDRESTSLLSSVQTESQRSDTPPVKESVVSLYPTEPIVEATPPDLPEEGPPLDDSFEVPSRRGSLLLNTPPQDELLTSISELHHSSPGTAEGGGPTEDRPELLLTREREERLVVALKKGFKGLGFGLSKELSGQQGRGVFVRSVVGNPAESDGRIQPGDEIIQANDDSLIDLPHNEVLSILRSAQGTVTLVIRRYSVKEDEPVKESVVSLYPTEPTVEATPPDLPEEGPPLDDSFEVPSQRGSLLLNTPPQDELLTPISELHHSSPGTAEGGGPTEDRSELLLTRELEERLVVALKKGFRGLGFGLSKELSGQQGRGVFVRSVVGNPAESDGRIQPGDEIIQANDDSLIDLPHNEVLSILRSAQGTVTLVIRRYSVKEDAPPLPPDSPLPLENSARLEQTRTERHSPPLERSHETIEPPVPSSTLSPQESTTSLGTDIPPPAPSASLLPQESSTSLELPPVGPLSLDDTRSVEPPAMPLFMFQESVISLETEEPPPPPSTSLLPQESSTSLKIEQPLSPSSVEPTKNLRPQENTTSLETEPPPAAPSSMLLQQESSSSLEIGPPVPPLSLLPSESMTSLDRLEQEDMSEPIPDSSDGGESDLDDLSMPPLPPSDDEAPPPGPHSPLPPDTYSFTP